MGLKSDEDLEKYSKFAERDNIPQDATLQDE